jgi:hypothetical protein
MYHLQKKHLEFLLIIAVLVFLATGFRGFMQGVDWGDDFAGYILQAQTLITGDFKLLQENMSRNDFVLNYPWGFPVLLTPVIHFFPANIVFIKKYVFFYFMASMVLTYFLSGKEARSTLYWQSC